MATKTDIAVHRPAKLVERLAAKFGIDPDKMLGTLKQTAFRQSSGGEVSNEQMMALLVVAEQYGLNPWTKEIFAFPDKANGIVPVVGVDGWSRILNEQQVCDGVAFKYSDATTSISGKEIPDWCECTIYRKDRDKPVTVREYFDEVRRGTGPWGSHPRRMLRHKALIQCARIAFGFVGIYDEDEARRIIDGEIIESTPRLTSTVKRKPEVSPNNSSEAAPAPKNEPITTGAVNVAPAQDEQVPAASSDAAGAINEMTITDLERMIGECEEPDEIDLIVDMARGVTLTKKDRAIFDKRVEVRRDVVGGGA